MHGFAATLEGREAHRDHRHGVDRAARRGDADLFPVGNALFLRQLLADLHIRLRLRFDQRVNAPVHQCSVQEYVVITSGKSGDALAIGFMSLPKLWRAGLTRWADMMFFLKGLSIGS